MAAMAADPLAAEVVGALEREDEEDCAQQWYFAREELERRSPSRADGMDAKRETYLRRSYCTFLQDLGMRLKVPQITIATAIVFCHRFFLRQSHLRNDRFTIATVCMFLAGKVEETPRPLKDVITTAHEVQTKKDPEALARIRQKGWQEHYEEQRELVLVGERLLLTTLGFDLNVLHPYRPLVAAVRRIGAAQQALAQVAWNFVNDGLRTSLCLQFRPHQIAAGAIFLAAKFLRIKLPPSTDQKGFHGFDVTESQLKEVSSQMLELYEQSKGASRGSIPSSNAAAPPSKGPPRASSAPLLQQSNGHTAHSSRPKPDSVSVNGPLATPRAFGRPTPSTGEQGYGPSLSESSSWQRSDAQPIKENRTTDEANGVSLDEDDAMSLDSEGGGVERAPQALQSVSPPESGGRNGEADQSGGGLHSVSPSKTGEGGKRKREESTLEDERGWRKEFERRKVVGTRVIETGPSEQRSELVKGESEQDEDEADEEQQRAWELLDEVELGGPVKERGTKSKVRKGVQGLLPMPLGEPSALTTLPECETGSVDENINGVGRRTASSRPRSGEETEGIKVDDFQAARGGIQGEADSQEGRDMRWRDEGNRSDTEGNPPHVLPKQRSPEVSRRGGDEAVEEGELPEGEGPSSPPVRGEVGLRKAGKEPLDSWRQSSRGQGAPMRAYSHGRDRHRERELDKDRHRQRDEGSPPKEQSIRRSKFS